MRLPEPRRPARHARPLLLLLTALPTLLSCGPPRQDLNDERQRRIRAESWIRKAETALASCRRHAGELLRTERQRVQREQALRRELARMRTLLRQSQRQTTQCHNNLGGLYRAKNAALGVVAVRATRCRKATPGLAMRRRLEAHRAALEACYRREILPRQAGLAWQGWVILELGPKGMIRVDYPQPAPRGAQYFWSCIQKHIATRQDLRSTVNVQCAQLLAFGPDPKRVPQGAAPVLQWPPPSVGPGYAKAGQVCHYNRTRHRGMGPVSVKIPFLSRPCAPGLKCCYPCGIPGCNSVCMKDCGPPRP